MTGSRKDDSKEIESYLRRLIIRITEGRRGKGKISTVRLKGVRFKVYSIPHGARIKSQSSKRERKQKFDNELRIN